MKSNYYALRDIKANYFLTPFPAPSDAAALRSLTEWANDETTMIGKHPADFQLWKVGAWDPAEGEMTGEKTNQHIADGNSVVRQGA